MRHVAVMIEEHYWRCIDNDAMEQLKKLFSGEGETFLDNRESA
jgi:hypothetical protein